MRVLAVSDEADRTIDPAGARRLRPDLVVGCGDVGFDVLGWLAESTGAPVVFVPGNHDPDVSGYRPTRSGLVVRAGFVTAPPWPPGATNADGRVVEVAGLRIAGLGGCVRYRPGPNQYTEAQQRRRARRLARRARWGAGGAWRRPPRVDIVLAHAAPRGLGDGDDPAHAGFEALATLARAVAPAWLLHGHVTPHPGGGDHWIGSTRIVNVFGHKLLEIAAGSAAADSATADSATADGPGAADGPAAADGRAPGGR